MEWNPMLLHLLNVVHQIFVGACLTWPHNEPQQFPHIFSAGYLFLFLNSCRSISFRLLLVVPTERLSYTFR